MGSVDNRVVEMKFDNKQFESGIQTSLRSLSNLKSGLNLDAATRSLSDLAIAGKNFSLSGISAGVDIIAGRFTSLGIIGMTALQNITNTAVDAGKRIANSLIGPMIEGGKNRALNIEQAKFQLEGLGVAWEYIKDDINYGVKDTAYGLDAAAKVASQLVASDIKVGDSMKTSLRAVSGVAAMTSSSYEDIGNIFTTVAGNGKLMTEQLRQFSSRGLNAAATLATYLNTTEANVRQMVTEGKIDFATFAAAMDNAFGEHAKDANKTFTGALSNMKAALSRIGADFATPAFENLKNVLNALIPVIDGVHSSLQPLIDTASNGMEALSKFAIDKLNSFDENKLKTLDGIVSNLVKSLMNVGRGLLGILKPIKESLVEFFPPITIKTISTLTEKIDKLTAKFKIEDNVAKKLKSTFKGVFSVFSLAKNLFYALIKVLSPVTTYLGKFGDKILTITSYFGDNLSKLDEAVKQNDSFYRILKKLTEYIKSDFCGLLPVIEDFYDSLYDLFEPLINTASKAKDAISDFLTNGFDGLNQNKMETFNVIGDTIGYLVESLLNIATAVLRIIKPITEAFAEVFPPVTAKNIRNIAESIATFTKKLIIGEDTADKIKSTFKGVFAIVDIVRQVFSALIRTLFPATDCFGALGDGILTVLADFGEYIAKIDETVRENDTFYVALQKFIDFVNYVFDTAKEKVEQFVEVFEKITGVDLKMPTLQDFYDLLGKIKDRALSISENFGKAKKAISDFFKSFGKDDNEGADKKSVAMETLSGIFKSLSETLGKVSPEIGKTLESISEAFGDTFTKIDFNRLYKLVNIGMLVVLITAINKFRSVLSTIFSFGRVFHNLNGILVGVRGTLTAYTNDIKSNTLLKIATSIAILAASLIALSMVKEENLTNALGAMAGLFIQLFGSMLIMEKLMAGDTLRGIFKMAGSMVIVSIAMSILASVVKKLGSLDMATLSKGILSMAIALASITTAINFLPKSLPLAGIGLMLVSTAMVILAGAIKALGKVKIENLAKGVLSMAVALAAITLAVRFIPTTLPIIGVGLLIVANAMVILAGAVKVLGTMSIAEIGKSMLILAGALTAIALAANLMTGAIPGATAIFIISAALTALCPVLVALGKMSLVEIGKSLLILSGAFVVIGVAAALLSPILPALLGFAAAMVLLSVGALAAGAGLAVLAVGISVLVTSAATIAALGNTLIYSASIIVEALTVLIMSTLSSLETIIPKAFDVGWKVILYFLYGIAKNIGCLLDAASMIIVNLLIGLEKHIDKITVVGLSIIVKLIDGLASMIEPLVQAGMNLMIKFIDGMADGIRNNTDSLFDALDNLLSAMIEFILSALQQLVRNIPIIGNELVGSLEDAKTAVRETLAPKTMEGIGKDAATATANGIRSGSDNVKSAGNDLGTSAKLGLDSVFDNFGSSGIDFGTDFARNLDGTTDLSSLSGMNLGTSATKGLNSTLGEFGSLGTDFGTDFSFNLGDTADLSSLSGVDLGVSATEGLGSTLGDFGSLGTDFGTDFSCALGDTAGLASSAGSELGVSTMDGLDVDLTNLGELAGDQYTSGLSSTKDDTKASADSISSAAINGLSNYQVKAQFQKSGSTSGTNYSNGIVSEKSTAKKSGVQIAISGANGANSKISSFRDAGVNSGMGFVNGISSTSVYVSRTAYNLAATALESMKSALDINSPSKKTEEIGMYSDRGLANGLNKFSGVVIKSANAVGETVLSSLQTAMSKVADIVNGDIDIDPTIRPVIDMSDVTDGVSQINSLFGQRTFQLGGISGQITGKNFDLLSGIASEMQKINNFDNSDVVREISQLRSDINALGTAMSKMQIKMDSGALVGSIVAPMDMALGQRSIRRGRCN